MRTVFCIMTAVIAGLGLAAVLALGTAAVSAAVYKSEAGIDSPVYEKVQSTGPAVQVAAGTGFVVGSSVIVWMFWSSRPRRKGTEEPGQEGRSEV